MVCIPPGTSLVSETTNKSALRSLEYSSSERIRNRSNVAGSSSFVSEASVAYVLTDATREKHSSDHVAMIQWLVLPIFIATSSIAEFFKNFAAYCGNADFPPVTSAKPWTLDDIDKLTTQPRQNNQVFGLRRRAEVVAAL